LQVHSSTNLIYVSVLQNVVAEGISMTECVVS